MKVTPIATGGMPGVNIGSIGLERTSPDRLAAAKAIAMGESPMRITPSDTPIDPQIEKTQNSIRRMKMRTNHTVHRNIEIPQELINQAQAEAQAQPQEISANPTSSEEVTEEIKPLSPQYAALAKLKRSLQVKERELQDRERAFQDSSASGANDLTARLKSEPLRVLQEQGVLTPEFYNSFTEFLVSGQSGMNPDIQALKEEIKALKEGVNKNFVDRDTAAEQQVLSEMRKEAEFLANDGEEFRLIRQTRNVPKVTELIRRTYKASGEVLDVPEAMKLVEDQLKEDYSPIVDLLRPQAPQPQPQMLQQQPKQQIRTLTNRDTAQVPLDRRTRALMAAQGLLRRG